MYYDNYKCCNDAAMAATDEWQRVSLQVCVCVCVWNETRDYKPSSVGEMSNK